MTTNPYAAPQTTLGGGDDGGAKVSAEALAALRRMWIAFSVSGLVYVIASLAAGVAYFSYARSHPSKLLVPFMLEGALSIALSCVFAGVSIARWQTPGSVVRQLASFGVVLKVGAARILVHVVAFLAPFVAGYGTVTAPSSGKGALADAMADVRLWTRLLIATDVITGVQQVMGLLATARVAGLPFVAPQIAFCVAQVIDIALLLAVERAAGGYIGSQRTSDFDVFAIALRRLGEVMLGVRIVTLAIQYGASLLH